MRSRLTRPLWAAGAGAAVLALALAGCSSASPGEEGDRTITIGHVQPESHSQHTCLAMTFQEDIQSADVGLEVQILSSGQGYQDTNEQLDALETGSLDATTSGLSQLGSRVEEF